MERMQYVGCRYVDFVNKDTGEKIDGVKVFFLTEKPDDQNVIGNIPEYFWYKPETEIYKQVKSWKPGAIMNAEFGRAKAPVAFYPVEKK